MSARWLSLLLLAAVSFVPQAALGDEPTQEPAQSESAKTPSDVQPVDIGEIYNVHQCGSLYLAGQPTPEDFAKLAKLGVKYVVTFRTDGEVEWDEQQVAKSAGMEFKAIPYGTLDSLTDEVFETTRKILRSNRNQPMLLHCGAATRVAAVWLAYRVLDENVELETALAEAEKIGLRSKALRERALQYIESQQ